MHVDHRSRFLQGRMIQHGSSLYLSFFFPFVLSRCNQRGIIYYYKVSIIKISKIDIIHLLICAFWSSTSSLQFTRPCPSSHSVYFLSLFSVLGTVATCTISSLRLYKAAFHLKHHTTSMTTSSLTNLAPTAIHYDGGETAGVTVRRAPAFGSDKAIKIWHATGIQVSCTHGVDLHLGHVLPFRCASK